MDRAQLKFVLASGPSRMLDVRKLHFDGGMPPLFKIATLNAGIFIKQATAGIAAEEEYLPPIGTMIYLPYDRKKPEDGGESFFFSERNLSVALGQLLGDNGPEPGHFVNDLELLRLLDSIPTFSPFLMKDVLERGGLNIPDGYFTIAEKDSATMKQRMRTRLRPLVATAFKGDAKSISNNSIERLVNKLWELNDLAELMPLIAAFRLDMKEAPEIFYCWLGIAFFESEYLRLQPRLKRFAEWIAKNPKPKEVLPRAVADHYTHSVALVRRLLQGHWKQSLVILQSYTTTYEELIGESGSATPFTEFLRQAKTHFWTLGGCLGRLEQSVELWERFCGRTNFERPTYERGIELFGMLTQINVTSAATERDVGFPAAEAAL